MLNASIIHRYGIVGIWDTYAATDTLFSGNEGIKHSYRIENGEERLITESSGLRDPMLDVDSLIGDIGAEYSDVTVAICANGNCVIQVVQFKTKLGYDKYKADNIVIFDQR